MNMKITLLQQDIAWGKPEDNVREAERAMDARPGADLYVLPEMFSTGFCTEPEGLAEPADSDTLRWMRAYARAHDCAVAGSVAVQEDGRYYNRFYFVKPDGEVCSYDKKHLFTYGGEDRRFTAGRERVVVEFRGVRILLQVCYDLRFPVWSRNCGDYDLAVYAASWPVSRIAAWDLLLRARAVENQCYVVGANRVGDDPICRYPGHSVIIHPYGNVMAELRDGETGCITADIDMEWLRGFREKFPVLHDADRFHIEK